MCLNEWAYKEVWSIDKNCRQNVNEHNWLNWHDFTYWIGWILQIFTCWIDWTLLIEIELVKSYALISETPLMFTKYEFLL